METHVINCNKVSDVWLVPHISDLLGLLPHPHPPQDEHDEHSCFSQRHNSKQTAAMFQCSILQ